jgi:hypothetical protein
VTRNDPCLDDHAFGGEPVPRGRRHGAMAQIARTVTGALPSRIENFSCCPSAVDRAASSSRTIR